jgi:hypothetical protein
MISLASDRCGETPAFKDASTFNGAQKRCFAASTASSEPPVDEAKKDAEIEKKERGMLVRLYGAGTIVGTGAIAYGAWWAINASMKMVGTVYSSPHIVAYAGFWFGFGTATMCAALAIGLYRLTFIRPEFAFRDTLNVVKKNDAVKAMLGNSIRDGKLKTYEIKGGRITAEGAMPKWSPHSIQLMYMIYGEKGMGLVTTVCVKSPSLLPRQLDPSLLAVDFLDKDKTGKEQETLIIVGDKAQLQVRDNIHRLLDLKLGSQK